VVFGHCFRVSRLCFTKDPRSRLTLSAEATQSSATPSWLSSDSSLPTPPSAAALTAPQAGPSNFRPITSHLPQQLNLRPTNSPTKRKRTQSPEKRPDPAPKLPAVVLSKKLIDLAPGKHAEFTRLSSGFKESTALRASSSIGDALAGSSPSFETAPRTSQAEQDAPPTRAMPRPERISSTPVDTIPTSAQRLTSPKPAAHASQHRPNAAIPPKLSLTRAEAEAAARQQGEKKRNEERARQQLEEESTAQLEQGLILPVSSNVCGQSMLRIGPQVSPNQKYAQRHPQPLRYLSVGSTYQSTYTRTYWCVQQLLPVGVG
jgi:hypothetical protein